MLSSPFFMKEKPNILAFIPARYDSSRFPGKPLAQIKGASMISRIYKNCAQVKNMEIFVVTDDDRIESHVLQFGGNVLRVNEPVNNGSERVYKAWADCLQRRKTDFIFNIQADIPLLKPQWLQKLSEFHVHTRIFNIATLVVPCPLPIETSPHKVKVIYSRLKQNCLYFSRTPLPYAPSKEWFYHLGVYSFQPESLELFAQSPPSYYENCEKLEQLRAMELGLKIGAVEIDRNIATVDIPEDIEQVEQILDHEQ